MHTANTPLPLRLATSFGGYSTALLLLCAVVLVLTGMPRMGFKLGSMPLYIIDILIVLTIVKAPSSPPTALIPLPFKRYIVAILVFATVSEIAAIFYSGDPIRPLYTLIRTYLAASLFFLSNRIIRTPQDLIAVAKAAIIGIGITAVLMILSSLPYSSSVVANNIFSISFLEPAAESVLQHYESISDLSTRGKSLVGVSILSGAFINTFWPLIALFVRLKATAIKKWRSLALGVTMLAPFGIVASYSRGAILGLFLVVGGSLFFGSSKTRRGIIVAVVGAFAVFSFVGWDSDLFYFERVVTRTTAAITNPYEDVRETERIYAYSEPFEHLWENPHFLLVGEGVSITKTGIRTHQDGKATHAVFAKAYYSYGFVASVVYIALLISGFRYLLRQLRRKHREQLLSPLVYQALFAGLLGMLPWFVFGHAAVSQPRGAMLFFLYFGLIASIRNIYFTESLAALTGRQNG